MVGGTLIRPAPKRPANLPYQSFVEKLPTALQTPAFVLRCAPLLVFNIFIMQTVAAGCMTVVFILLLPLLPVLFTILATFLSWVAICVARTPGAGNGGRASRGDGMPESSIEALQSLLVSDGDVAPQWQEKDFSFLEVSVQETSDNKLVVLHELSEKGFKRAFPRKGDNIAIMEALEGELHTNFERLSASEVSLEQLQSLHYFGQDDVRVVELEEYLKMCRSHNLGKPVAIEVRHIFSDIARARLVRVVSTHRQEMEASNDGGTGLVEGAYGGLGIVSIVAEPGRFTASFAEFGSPRWAHWAKRMREAEVPVLLKCCHAISLGFLAPDA